MTPEDFSSRVRNAMEAMSGAIAPMLPKATTAPDDEGIAGLGGATDIDEGRSPLDDVSHAGGPDHLAIAGPDFFNVVTQGSLDEVELAGFLDHEGLPGPTGTFPGADIAGAEHRLATAERGAPFHVEFGRRNVAVEVALVVTEVGPDERFDLPLEGGDGKEKEEEFHSEDLIAENGTVSG